MFLAFICGVVLNFTLLTFIDFLESRFYTFLAFALKSLILQFLCSLTIYVFRVFYVFVVGLLEVLDFRFYDYCVKNKGQVVEIKTRPFATAQGDVE